MKGPKRTGLIGAGALLIALVIGFAVTQGIGQADVPSDAVAFVEEVGSETGTITREEFDTAVEQAAARAGIRPIPAEGTPEFENLKTAAINDLLDIAWIQGEAEELGITVTDEEVAEELNRVKTEEFASEREFQAFIERAGFTPEDIDLRIRLQLLSDGITAAIEEEKPVPSEDQVEDFYEESIENFKLPESRNVRLILNPDRSKVVEAQTLLEADSSDANWRQVARRLSTDSVSRSNGGLRTAITEGLLEEPLGAEVFEAEQGVVSEPVKTPLGWYVFEVESVTPARTQELKEVEGPIRRQLAQQLGTAAFEDFVNDYGNRWQARTICADDFVIERCSNFSPSTRPQGAPAACYEENPPREPKACPAPVLQSAPALPGTVSPLTPDGTRVPQRPRPDLKRDVPPEPAAAAPLPGAVPSGLPPGVAP